MQPQKIVLIGGPSTGKSTLIEALTHLKYQCLPEISREVTRKAKEEGFDQLFLSDPLKFSKLLLEGRISQFKAAKALSTKYVFIDRGIPDITAYMDHFKQDYPKNFTKANKKYIYDKVFILPIWKSIYTKDDERFEAFELAKELQDALITTYTNLGYNLIEVPKDNVEKRVEFVLSHL
ncbi:AAA family ATPase [Psychroflexus sp. ALD_RP9]|uniref:AAA family ATPase n=1 Tax=Psychroflexus sp. ALD_RP9 TaxID=2777186 RepID=UPI001A8F998B|nr:ATP-binding protein [Psychroflexus sp. ALD_RP9]QSS97321.1 ATP-binding protein [Psychroflexus sp. ALD_RP9]